MTAKGWRSPARSWRLVFFVFVFLSPVYLIGLLLFVLYTPGLADQVRMVWAISAILAINLAIVSMIYFFSYRRRMRAFRTTLLKLYPIVGVEQAGERIENVIRERGLDCSKTEKTTGGDPPYCYDFFFSIKDRGVDIGVHRPDRGGSYVSVRWRRGQDEAFAVQLCESIDHEMLRDASHGMSRD